MTARRWLGRADVVRQVDTIQITADDAATTYSVTIGGITVSVPGAGSGVNDTASDLQTALNNETHPYFAAIAWTVATDTVTGTGPAAGEPFTASAAATSGTGSLSHSAAATAAESPNHFNVAANWSGGAVPTTNDEALFANTAVPMLWDLDQSALSLNLVRVDQSFTGWIGLNPAGFLSAGSENASYAEYRDTHFAIDADRVELGREGGSGRGTGSGRINIDNGDTGTPALTVFNTAAAPRDTGQLCIDYIANDAQATAVVIGAPGGIGFAARRPEDTATLATIDVLARDPNTRCVVGEGVTLAGYRQNGGNNVLSLAADIANVWVNGGVLKTDGEEFTITQLDIYGGICRLDHYDSTAIATLINLWNGGTLDMSRNSRARTIATLKSFPDSTLIFDPGYITITTQSWEAELLKVVTAKP